MFGHRIGIGTLIVVTCLLGLIQQAGAAVQYTVTDLGSVNGAPNRINQSGQAAGFIATPGAADQGYLWNGTAMQTLGTLAGSTRALGLNDTGMVVGWSQVKPYPQGSTSDRRAFLWQNGVLQNLNTPEGPVLQTAFDVNDAGQVVIQGATSGYLWHQGNLTDLVFQDPRAINEAGQVVGGRYTGRVDRNGTPIEEPVLWDHGTITPLGTLGGTDNSMAMAINDHGQIVGTAHTGSAYRAFLWENGTMQEIPTGIPASGWSDAFGVNNLGQVVGRMNASGFSPTLAYVYSGGVVSDLNGLIPANSGWVLQSARDINDFGQIVGAGTLNGVNRSFLLTPVPEPASILLLMGSACAILRRRK